MIDRLLVLWVATLGLTRVDFSGGADFLLSPFIVLSPLLIALGWMRTIARGGAFRLPPRILPYSLLLSCLLTVILVSAFFGMDLETAARRTLLLFYQIISVLLVGVLLANRPDPRRILGRGAVLGLALAVVFNALQVTYWFSGEWLPAGLGAVISIEPGNYQGLIPRLTGVSHDPNHGGLLIVAYMFLAAALGGRSVWTRVLLVFGGLSLLLTLSRSALLAGAVVCAVWWVRRAGMRVRPAAAMGGAACVGLLAAILLISPAAMDAAEAAWNVVGGRFSLAEGSTRQHSEVMARGWEVATRDLKHVLLGVGYGNAYTTLQDIFPGNRYGNFHSLFLTLFAESGVFAVVLGAVLFLIPLAWGGFYQPMIAGLLVFNIFQQSPTEPLTWVLLLLGWTGVGAAARRAGAGHQPAGPAPLAAAGERLPAAPPPRVAPRLRPSAGTPT